MNSSNGGANTGTSVHEVEVMAKPTRRRFSAEYKLKILREAGACIQPGELGALLRREGLYFSNLQTWRAQLEAGEIGGLAPKKRGPAPQAKNPLVVKVVTLEPKVTRYKARAERAEALVALQKKSPRSWGSLSRGTASRPDGDRHRTASHPGRGPGLPGIGRATGQLLPMAHAQSPRPRAAPSGAPGLAAGGTPARAGCAHRRAVCRLAARRGVCHAAG